MAGLGWYRSGRVGGGIRVAGLGWYPCGRLQGTTTNTQIYIHKDPGEQQINRQHPEGSNTLLNKPRNQIPVHQEEQAKRATIRKTPRVRNRMARILDSHPRNNGQQSTSRNGETLQ